MSASRPALAEPDPRYWRRRANFRVRRERWTRRLRYWAVVVLIDMTIGVALLQAGTRIADRIRTSDALAVDRIEVAQTERADPATIRSAVASFVGENVLDVNLHDVSTMAERDPWVLEATAKRLLPDGIRIDVIERRPRALALIQGLTHVIDDRGFVVGPTGPGLHDDLPVLTGLEGLNDEELIAALRRGVAVVERLEREAPGWTSGISELDLARADRIVARPTGGGPPLILDGERVERNLRAFMALEDRILQAAGPVRAIDLRWRGRINVREDG